MNERVVLDNLAIVERQDHKLIITTSRKPFLSDLQQSFWLWLALVSWFSLLLFFLPVIFRGGPDLPALLIIAIVSLAAVSPVPLYEFWLGFHREHTYIFDAEKGALFRDGHKLCSLAEIKRTSMKTLVYGSHRSFQIQLVAYPTRQIPILQTRIQSKFWQERKFGFDILEDDDLFTGWYWQEYRGQSKGFRQEEATIFQAENAISRFLFEFVGTNDKPVWPKSPTS